MNTRALLLGALASSLLGCAVPPPASARHVDEAQHFSTLSLATWTPRASVDHTAFTSAAQPKASVIVHPVRDAGARRGRTLNDVLAGTRVLIEALPGFQHHAADPFSQVSPGRTIFTYRFTPPGLSGVFVRKHAVIQKETRIFHVIATGPLGQDGEVFIELATILDALEEV